MVASGLDRSLGVAAALAVLWLALVLPSMGQEPAQPPRAGETTVAEVVLEGNSSPLQELPKFSTRAGQLFDPKLVEDDVRALHRSGRFIDIRPKYQRVPDGIVVIFQVVERPTIRQILFVGNKVSSKQLAKKCELKVGDAMDPHMIEDARRRLEEHYREKGYAKASVTAVEGTNPGDRKVVFLINEGNKQRIWWTRFEGNTIATDARLRTQIQSKPGIFWILGGYVDPQKIREDLDRLTAYYRRLGFFQAKIGRHLEYDEDYGWLTITYVINEGIRYQVRNVSVIGNEKFTAPEIQEPFTLLSGEFFDQDKLEKDINSIRDLYGGQGHIAVDVEADTRFVEDPNQPGQVDLVYDIAEGSQYQVGRISVKINGEYPHTRQWVILNRLSQRPGDIVDTRLIRADEIRIKRSQLFENNPAKGQTPRIAIVMPDGEEHGARQARRQRQEKSQPRAGSNFRGQSPDRAWPSKPAARPQPERPQSSRTTRTEPAKNVIFRGQDPGYGGSALGATGPAARGVSAYRQPAGATQAIHQHPPSGHDPRYFDPRVAQANSQSQSTPNSQYFDPRVTRANYQPPGAQPPAGGQIIYGPPGGNIQPSAVAPPPGAFVQPNGGFVPPGGVAPPGPVFGGPPVGEGAFVPDPNVGPIPSELPPGLAPPPGGVNYGVYPDPNVPTVDLDVITTETQTGRLMFGVGVNSNAGLIGNFVIDEQHFDIMKWPTSWYDITSGRAFRGNGQRFRLEAAPGTEVSRYVISFSEPYLNNWPISFSTAGSYYQRFFRDWREERVSGRFGLGYQLPFRPDLSVTTGLRLEEVEITEPRTPTPPELTEVLGHNTVVGLRVGLMHDTRDSPFLPTEGFMTNYEFEQVLGSFEYPRFTAEASRYFTLHQRPDGSGRHVFKIGGEFGISGEDTPIYDHFFAGGFNTLRGFRFRGASPRNLGVIVGGELQLLGTTEYMFPITADDMLRGVVFADFGTVEREIEINSDNFRLAPGFGLRINVPALGPAPLAFDFAFPILEADGDENQVFAFFVGINR